MPANDSKGVPDYYKNKELPMHWDLAIMYDWDFFQYQITKYVMRWKQKHDTPEARLKDLKKARHFLDKYIENAAAYDLQQDSEPGPGYVCQDPGIGPHSSYTVGAPHDPPDDE